MRDRLQARGLAIGLAVLLLILLSPTPVPRFVQQAWEVGARAAASGDAAGVSQALETLQAVFPWAAEVRQSEIPLALSQGDGYRVLTLLDSGAAVHADPAEAECWRSEALVLEGRWKEGAALLSESAPGTCPRTLQRLRVLADEALARQEPEQALALLMSLTTMDPFDTDASTLHAAIGLLSDPASVVPMLHKAASAGDPLAKDLLRVATVAGGGHQATVVALCGRVFLQHRAWALAALAFDRLTTLEPGNGEAYAYYGIALERLGLDGRSALEQGVRLAPDSATTQSALGLYWQEQGQSLRALPYLKRAVEMAPESGAFSASLAAAEAGNGDIQGALNTYRHAAQLEPGSPVFWTLLADFSLSHEVEIAETGLPAARNALGQSLESPAALDRLGYGHLLLGDYSLAERLLCKAVRLDPASASARLHYGLLLATLGRGTEAEAQLLAASDLGGETSLGDLARRALTQIRE